MNSEKALAKILRDRIQKFIDRGGDLRTLIKQVRQTIDLMEAAEEIGITGASAQADIEAAFGTVNA